MSGRLRLAVVIINYKGAGLVRDCLESLVPELDGARDAVIVVDNASGDSSPDEIEALIAKRAWAPLVRLIRSPVNGGFSAGNNVGLRAASAERYLLLNSDTIVRPGAIKTMLDAMDARPRVGLLGPRLEWMDGEPQVNGRTRVSPIGELVRAASLGPLTRLLRKWAITEGIESEPDEPDWLSFSCVLVRGEVIERVGPMDEGYFMYFEDIDYCLRAREAGWGCFVCRGAHVAHLKGGTSGVQTAAQERRRRPAYYYAARARYLTKFYGVFGLWSANALWMLGRLISGVREALGGRDAGACPGEWRDNWTARATPAAPARG